MDEDFAELEAELAKLQPRAVPPHLGRRIASELAPRPAGGLFAKLGRVEWRRWRPMALGALAGAALIVQVSRTAQPEPAPHRPAASGSSPRAGWAGFVPAKATRTLYAARDEGLVYPASNPVPSRRWRLAARDTLAWRNQATNAVITISYPREEVLLLPVIGQ